MSILPASRANDVLVLNCTSAGIGFATVRHLLRAKAGKVYLAARDEGRAKDAIKLLHDEGLGKEGSGSEVLWHQLELGDSAKTKLSAEEFLKKESRLDVLSKCFHGSPCCCSY